MRTIHNPETLAAYCDKCAVTYHYNADAANTIDLDDEQLAAFLAHINHFEIIKDADEIESEILRCDMAFNDDKDYAFVRASRTDNSFVIAVPRDAILLSEL